MIEPLPLPRLTSADARWRSTLLGRARRIPFAIGATTFTLSFAEPQPLAGGRGVRLVLGEAALDLRLSDWRLLLAATPDFRDVDADRIPDEFLPSLLETALSGPLDELSRRTGLSCRFENVLDGHAPHTVGIVIDAAAAGRSLGTITTDNDSLAVLSRLVAAVPAVAVRELHEAPLVAGVEIGLTSLPLDDLRSLRIHDVLLMDVTTWPQQRSGLVRIGPQHAWRVTVDDAGVTLEELKSVSTAAPPAVGAATVPVVIEAGQVEIPADRLTKLNPGDTLERHHAEHVLLRVHRAPIAGGELVLLGERLGVRILTVNGPSSIDDRP